MTYSTLPLVPHLTFLLAWPSVWTHLGISASIDALAQEYPDLPNAVMLVTKSMDVLVAAHGTVACQWTKRMIGLLINEEGFGNLEVDMCIHTLLFGAPPTLTAPRLLAPGMAFKVHH